MEDEPTANFNFEDVARWLRWEELVETISASIVDSECEILALGGC